LAARLPAWPALLWLAFVIYGTLVPLDFPPRPWSHAWATFSRLSWDARGPLSLTDLVTNVVLYLPLALLARGAWSTRGPAGAWLAGGAIGLGCVLLSLGLEFTQGFTVSRTPLFTDILMNALGAGIGLLLWPVLGARLAAGLGALSACRARPCPVTAASSWPRRLAPVLLVPYLGVLAWANGWFSGAWLSLTAAMDRLPVLHLAPFYQHYFADIGFALQSVIVLLLAYVPIGLGLWAARRRAGSVWTLARWVAFWGLLVAGLFEAGKLFLAERQPDFTNPLFAAVGSALGALLACRQAPSFGVMSREPATRPVTVAAVHGVAVGVATGWRVLAVTALIAALYGLWNLPFARVPLALGALVYGLLLWRHPQAWLVAVPALLPVLDLAPWSGRFYFDEFDLLLLLTLAVGYWRHATAGATGGRLPVGLRLTLGLYTLSCLISLAIALWPLPPLDLNSFTHYYSPYNGLRVAKGLLWVLALLPLLASQARAGVAVGRLFALGMALGLAGMVLAVAWERAVFSGLTDYTRDFRVAGLMSSMHTGGSHIEAYLVLALPFLALLLVGRHGGALAPLVAVLFLGGLYALAVTFARGGYLALALGLLVLALGWWTRARRAATGRPLTPVAVMAALAVALLAGALLAPILGGSFARDRLAQSGRDAGVRAAHWRDALTIKDQDWRSELFGMGLGRYPITYFYRSSEGTRSASFSYFDQDGRRGLALGAGTPVYVEQKVPVRHGVIYQLEVTARAASGNAKLNVLLCERTYFDSFGCASASFPLSDAWSVHRQPLVLDWPGGRGRPVTLSLENPAPQSTAELSGISLRDPEGRNWVSNGDFANGADRWFFTAFNHLGWHIKNLWVGLLFEQGVLGLLAFALLTGYGLYRIGGRFLRSGDMVSLAVLAGWVGFLTVSMVDSLFDAPRLTLLFLLTLFVGSLAPHAQAATADAKARPAPARPAESEPMPAPTAPGAAIQIALRPRLWRDLCLGVGLLAGVALALPHLPGLPYNVRELIYQGSPVLSALALSVFWFWFAGLPAVLALGLSTSRPLRALYLPATLLHAAGAAWLVTAAVPIESVGDLVGTPVLGWPGRLEELSRLTVLFAAASVMLTGGAWLARSLVARYRQAGLPTWALAALILLGLAHWVVVERAATDNLTELMAGGGGLRSGLALTACGLLLATCASLLAVGKGLTRRAILFWVVLAVPVSYGMLALGLEDQILKYGQEFSALQFLLSTDRTHLVSGVELALRYAVASCAALAAIALAQWPFLGWSGVTSTPRHGRGRRRARG
jgi:VanZ family protein